MCGRSIRLTGTLAIPRNSSNDMLRGAAETPAFCPVSVVLIVVPCGFAVLSGSCLVKSDVACMLPAGLLLVLFTGPSALAEDWPWFLGPQHTGESGEQNLSLDWSKSAPAVVWKQSIGTGYSAPSVLADKLVVHHRMGNEEVISCRNVVDGRELWNYRYPSSFEDPYGYNNGPRCSPVLTPNHCFTLGAEGMLVCVSMANGTLVWEKNLQKEFKLPEWFFGMGCSPVLDGDRLIVLVGGQPNSGVVAFNAVDGAVLWEAVGQRTWDGVTTADGETFTWTEDEMVVSYSSPIIREIHGRRHLLCLMRQGLVSLDPETGSENFSYWFRPRVHESVNAARPIVIDDQIFLSAAYQLGAALLKVNPDGKSFTQSWKNSRNLLAHWSTPIHVDGCVYGFSGRHENEGELRCIQVSDGKVLWSTSGFDADLSTLSRDRTTGHIVEASTGKVIPYPFFGRGSLIRVGDRFIVLGERGTISVVEVNKEKFVEHGRFFLDEIDYPAWAAPVLSNGKMYLRSEKWLVCVELLTR
jgi:outer membrane protein assembly factor BamB